ncbi:hypothetical protein K469DRAFT_805678 [Zopfia rhizophila CBS 207.26]|uniref:Uncharacterized protein n=1 Tax=Zopfia rhizophila CBS 207.26 TaxID=1314779 RepID=A0A6A6DF05_9PEZI|nr:hypothetical protein K469DRAFT_805678 [Zopfia rhizophila CBS 207.26]
MASDALSQHQQRLRLAGLSQNALSSEGSAFSTPIHPRFWSRTLRQLVHLPSVIPISFPFLLSPSEKVNPPAGIAEKAYVVEHSVTPTELQHSNNNSMAAQQGDLVPLSSQFTWNWIEWEQLPRYTCPLASTASLDS